MELSCAKNRRILIVDDNEGVHQDFRQILQPARDHAPLRALEAQLFEEPLANPLDELDYDLHSAYQGQEGLELVESSFSQETPFALAFVDVRMPPGWDGVETVNHLWRIDPRLQIVICTAFSDYDWDQIARRLGCSDQLLILKKPFEPIEVKQLACALTQKWNLAMESARRMEALQDKQAELELLILKAEEASRLKDEFLAMVSHELRNPLHVLLGCASLLSRANLSAARLEEAVATIQRSVRAQTQLVDDLLDCSRIVSGNLRLELGLYDVGALVNAAADSARNAATAKRIQLNLEITPWLPRAWLDAERVKRILWNLLSNAIKFTPTGGLVEVQVKTDGGQLRIVVRDNGEGIAEEFVPYVFDRFRQADSSITRRSGGLGLGLSIVRHLVELHGGTVRAESPGLGKGATFVVELPLLTERSAAATDAAAPSATELLRP
jgi:signal transduction histidine kinase